MYSQFLLAEVPHVASCLWMRNCVDKLMFACVHVWLSCHQNSMGLVYLKFEAVAGGAAALNALNGRWFAGKMITAEFYNEAQYNAKFGL